MDMFDRVSSVVVILCLFIFSFAIWKYIWWRKDRKCPLVHLTAPQNAVLIATSKQFTANGYAIWSIRRTVFEWCEYDWELLLATMISPVRIKGNVPIPELIRPLFHLVFPSGPFTAWKCICGNYYAHYHRIPCHFDEIPESSALQIHAQLYLTDLFLSLLILSLAAVKIITMVDYILAASAPHG